jgi:hypothetical protein
MWPVRAAQRPATSPAACSRGASRGRRLAHKRCLGHNHAPAPEGRARNYISAIAMNPR